MWELTSGANFYGINKKILRNSNWKLCFMVSQGKKNTYGKIQGKMVWPIQDTMLFTQ
jgi:hypothetical protein